MITECRCSKCGKTFISAPCHIYKDNGKIFCSWTCYNHRNDDCKTKNFKVVEQYTKSGRAVGTYSNAIQAANQVNGTVDGVRTACRKCTFYKGYLWRYKNDLS